MNQRGFATLEVILMVMVIGILASIAIPRFTDITTKANTAKIQADLSTIDTAIQVYYMNGGTADDLKGLGNLDDYLNDAANIKPPTGKAYYKDGDTVKEMSLTDSDSYVFNTDKTRAVLKGHTAGDFTTKATSTDQSGSGSGSNASNGGTDSPGDGT